MKEAIQLRRLVSYVCLLMAVFPRQLSAYLDPGTGSYFFQILIGILLGSLVAIKIFWGRIRTFIIGLLALNKRNMRDDK